MKTFVSNHGTVRPDTRKARYKRELLDPGSMIDLPHALATLSFQSDANVAAAFRICANWGFKELLILGKMPERSLIRNETGSTFDYVNVKNFATSREFIDYVTSQYRLVAIEMTDSSLPITMIDKSRPVCICTGNESCGVPGEILAVASQILHIPTTGFAKSMNTSMALGTVAWELNRGTLVGGEL